MKLPFLHYFKWKRRAAPVATGAAPPPLPPLDKPASERFGKTVMPNVSRIVGLEPLPDFPMVVPIGNPLPVAPAPGLRKVSLGGNGAISLAGKAEARPAAERTVALLFTDLVPHLPPGLLQASPIDREQRVLFKASELERGMASCRPTVLLRSIFQQAPDFFVADVAESDTREVVLPFAKVLEQFTALQVRPDQVCDKLLPQLETPFLQMTIEDGKRLGTAATSIPATLPPVSIPSEQAPLHPTPVAADPTAAPLAKVAPIAPRPMRPIRLPVPNDAESKVAEAPAPSPIRLQPPLAAPPAAPSPHVAKKISPNGMGVPATERVPASGGPPVPTPSPAAAPAPVRIPFKISPPSNDLRTAPVPAPKVAAVAFSAHGPRVRLSLGNILRGISPFQLSGPIAGIAETAVIEIPFSIIEPQLSLGRIAISPAQFQAALPEEYRALVKIEEADLPIALPLQEVLQNLPNKSLQLRDDQEEIEITDVFETPFSTKAAEDAARLQVSNGPIGKAVAGLEEDVSAAASARSAESTADEAVTRSALQVAFDTDEALDAKSIVTHASRLPGISACAVVFSDGLSLAGNIPAEYEADALCALAPSILKRISDQMIGANLGPLNGITLFCAKTPVSFFAHGNICLAALHSAGEIAAEVRARLESAVRELARIYAQPA
jgi:predicted regulator of Ras-like GTPase activity (Roadblock/LC7/MglB family)